MAVRGTSTLRTILGNAGWLVIAEIFGRALTFLAIVHLSRRLGPESMGIIELGLSMFGFMALVALGGVEVLATRQASRTVTGLGRLATTEVVVAWLWTLPAAAVGIALLVSFDHPAPTTLIAAGIAASAVLSPLALRFAFQGRERMDALAIGSVLGHATWTGCVLLFVRGPDDLPWIPVLWMAGEVARVSTMLVLFSRRFGRLKPTRARVVGAYLRASAPISVGRIARGLIYFVDVLVLGLFAPLHIVGLYAIGLRLPLFLISLTSLTNRALFPSFVRVARAGGPEASAALLATILPLTLSLSIAAACSLAVSGQAFLSVLFGEVYGEAALWMAILLWRAPAAALSGLYRMVLWAEAPRLEAKNSVIATTICVTLLFLLTPLVGATGAALSMLIGEIMLAVLYAWAARSLVGRLHLDRRWMCIQGASLLGLAGWSYWVQGQGVWTTILSAVVAGSLCGFIPLIPQIPALRGALRR